MKPPSVFCLSFTRSSLSSAIVAALLAVSQLGLHRELACWAALRGGCFKFPFMSSAHLVRLDRTRCVAFAATAVQPSDGWLEVVTRPVAVLLRQVVVCLDHPPRRYLA